MGVRIARGGNLEVVDSLSWPLAGMRRLVLEAFHWDSADQMKMHERVVCRLDSLAAQTQSTPGGPPPVDSSRWERLHKGTRRSGATRAGVSLDGCLQFVNGPAPV